MHVNFAIRINMNRNIRTTKERICDKKYEIKYTMELLLNEVKSGSLQAFALRECLFFSCFNYENMLNNFRQSKRRCCILFGRNYICKQFITEN